MLVESSLISTHVGQMPPAPGESLDGDAAGASIAQSVHLPCTESNVALPHGANPGQGLPAAG